MRHLPRWATRDERPHLPPPGYMAIGEAIFKTGVFHPLHSFINQVLEFFDIVPFHLFPNSYRLIVALYIAFSELCETVPSVGHFAFIHSWGGEFTNLIGEWLEAEKLNAPNPTPLSLPPDPLTKDAIGTENAPAGAPEQQPVANTDEETVTSNPSSVVKESLGKGTSRVTGSRTLIDLKEEHVAIVDDDLPIDLEGTKLDADLPAWASLLIFNSSYIYIYCCMALRGETIMA